MNHIEEFYNEIHNKIGQITTLFAFIPLLWGIFLSKYFNKPLKIIYLYLLGLCILNGLMELFIWSATEHYEVFWKKILDYFQISNTNFFNGLFYFFRVLLIGLFFSKVLKIGKNEKIILNITIFLCVFLLINYFFIDGFRNYGLIGGTLTDLFLIILPSVYLFQLSNNPPDISLQKVSYFWISIALFLPHLIQTGITFLATDLYDTDFVLFCKIHIFRNLINIISQLLFVIAFTKAKYLKYL